MIGRQISRYRIVEQIGSGGMSVVYKGHDTGLDREVAVKVLHPHLAAKEESRRRFSREARAVARLRHPNILEIYDFSGDDAPDAFIVTEYIRGQTLRAFAEQHAFDPPELAAMAVHELAAALEHAHLAGVIHRDLKPDNVMLREDGLLKLMDFGIARVLDREERMTMTGALVGSPAHMAPEIIEGQEAGRESDIFSLGTILYWLCCRKLPFLGANTTQTLKLVLDGTYPDPRLSRPAVSDTLAGIIARCLARDPDDRYSHASELRDALAAALLDAGIERPGEELAAFFAAPAEVSSGLRTRLAALLLARAEGFFTDHKDARALDCLNRVLALDPSEARARSLIDAMGRRRKRARRLAKAAMAALGLLMLGGAALAVSLGPGTTATPVVGPPPLLVTANPARAGVPAAQESAAATGPAEPLATDAGPDQPEAAPEAVSVRLRPGSARKRELRRLDAALTPVLAVPQTGLVSIKVHPYAPIQIDGTVVNADKPFFEGPLPVGRHTVRIASACCSEWEREIEVGPEPAPPLVVRLQPRPALVRIVSPHDVHVMIAGVYRGTSGASARDPIAVPLPEGAFRGKVSVRLYQDGFADQQLEEDFVAGSLKTLQVELARQ